MIWRIRCIFALQALVFGAWLPRIPEVKDGLGLSPLDLALVLLGMPAGIMVMLAFAGRIVRRIGPPAALSALFPPYLACLGLLAFSPSPAVLCLILALTGVLMAMVELAQNLIADGIEKATGRLIMSSCHGFWSLGIMAGSLSGAALAGAAVPPGPSGAVLAAVILPLSLVLIAGLRRRLAEGTVAAPAPAAAAPRAGWPRPDPAVLKIGFFLFGIALLEGAMMDWAPLFLRDTFALGPGAAGLGLTLYTAFMTLGRLRGDALRERFGARLAGQSSAGLALAALCLLTLSAGPASAYAALVLIGLGASLGFPLAVSSAALVPGVKVEGAVALITFMALLGFLVGPPMIGFVTEFAGFRWGLASAALPLLVSLALAPALGPRRQAAPLPA